MLVSDLSSQTPIPQLLQTPEKQGKVFFHRFTKAKILSIPVLTACIPWYTIN